jgi:colanic acid biosynthesis glycosyl transferase WcaI
MFAGNVGAAQDFPAILDAAERLKGEAGIHWVVLGEGRMLDWVRSEIVRRGLGATMHVLGQHPASSMPAFFAHADAMLVSLSDDPVFALTVPAKVQAYLACGRPIVAMLDGEGARVVQDAQAGLVCPPGDSAALAQAVLELTRMSAAERERFGTNGLACARAEFDRAALMGRLDQVLAQVARTTHSK